MRCARAAETNRPVGLMIRQYGGVSGFAFTLFLAEKPQPYCGDTTTSLMSVTSQGLSWFTTGDTGGGGLIRIGDTVQLNYQGGIYRITVGDTDANGYLLAGFPWTMTPVSAVPRICLPECRFNLSPPPAISRCPRAIAAWSSRRSVFFGHRKQRVRAGGCLAGNHHVFPRRLGFSRLLFERRHTATKQDLLDDRPPGKCHRRPFGSERQLAQTLPVCGFPSRRSPVKSRPARIWLPILRSSIPPSAFRWPEPSPRQACRLAHW